MTPYSKRIIPTLLMENGTLVKGTKFSKHQILGDPINAVKIFSDHEVDELIILDRSNNKNLNEKLLSKISSEARMPIAYGGGITSEKSAVKLISLGFERVVINRLLYTNPRMIKNICREIGSQAVIVSINVSRKKMMLNQARRCQKKDLKKIISVAIENLSGEIMINNIDAENQWDGIDYQLIDMFTTSFDAPFIYQGGIGNKDHIQNALRIPQISAIAVGSFFLFSQKNNGVLIHIPDEYRKNYGHENKEHKQFFLR